MANPLNRTWYNTLVDDDGSGTTGTVWNKTQVDGLLDSVDASLASLVDKAGAAAALQIPRFTDTDTLAATGELTFNPATGALVVFHPVAGLQVQGTTTVMYVGVDEANARVVLHMGTSPHLVWFRSSGVIEFPNGRLKFPATQVASADPNTFDDYREVPWTPIITGSGGASGQGYEVLSGHATKSGNLMVCTGRIKLNVLGTITGAVQIGNFPVAAKAGHPGLGTVMFSGLAATLVGIVFVIPPGATKGDLLYMTPTGGTGYGYLAQGHLAVGTDLTFTISYQTE